MCHGSKWSRTINIVCTVSRLIGYSASTEEREQRREREQEGEREEETDRAIVNIRNHTIEREKDRQTDIGRERKG